VSSRTAAKPVDDRVAVQVASELEQVSTGARRDTELRKKLMQSSAATGSSLSHPSNSDVARTVTAERAVESLNSQTVQAPPKQQAAPEVQTPPTQVEKPKTRTWSGWFSSMVSSANSALETVGNATIGVFKVADKVRSKVADVALNVAGAVKDAVVSGVQAIPSVCSAVAEKVGSAIVATVQGAAWCVTHPLQAVQAVGSALYSAGKSVVSFVGSAVEFVKSAVEVGCQAVVGALKLGGALLKLGGQLLYQLVSDPKAFAVGAWNAGCSIVKYVASAVSYVASAAYSGAAWCIQNPGEALQAAGSLLYSAGKAIGSFVSSIAVGAWNGIKGVLTGEISLGQALLNTFIFCCEMSGLADLWGTVKHGALALAAYGKGDKQAALLHLGQAAMHGAFVAVAIATISTGGLAAPVLVPLMAARALVGVALKQGIKQGLKACAREFLEHGAKEIGEAAIKKMGEPAAKKLAAELPQEMAKITLAAEKAVGAGASPQVLAAKVNELALERVIQLQGEGIATTMGKTMSEELATKGSEVLTRKYVTALGEEVGYTQTKALLRELGLVKHIDDLTHDMLASMGKMNPKQASQHIVDTLGVSKKEADKMAREVQKLLKSGKSDEAIKQVLEDRMTKEISGFVSGKMESSFKDTFRKGLRGELKDPDNIEWSTKLREGIEKRADDLAKDPKTNPGKKSAKELADDLTDDLVEGGWEGVEKGIKRAVRELVREGIDAAFKRLRARVRGHLGDSADESISTDPLRNDVEKLEDGSKVPDLANKKALEGQAAGPHQREIESRLVTQADGSVVRIKQTYEDDRLVGEVTDVVSDSSKQRAKKERAEDDIFTTAA
jgi:hypothetical protein